MYSQYQPQQRYSATVVSTPQHIWNGQQWVPATSNASSGGNPQQQPYQQQSYQQQQPYQQHQQGHAHSTTQQQQQQLPPNPVHTYSQYYQEYAAQVKQHQAALSSSNNHPASARAHLKSLVDWAQYRADQCSRAAHYFHQNPGVQVAPPELELPPAPTPSSQQQQPHQQHAPQQQYQQPHATQGHPQQQYAPQPPAQSHYQQQLPHQQPSHKINQEQETDQAPRSLKEYVDRCLSQCQSPAEKAQVMLGVQTKIQEALQEGNMHTKNWSKEALIPPRSTPDVASAQGEQPQMAGTHHAPGTGDPRFTAAPVTSDYHGASSSRAKQHMSPSPPSSLGNGSYYGPSTTNTSTTNPLPQQPPKQMGNSYYGPDPGTSDLTQDFVPLNRSKKSKKKRAPHEQPPDQSGFNQSSDTLTHRAKRFAGPGGLAEVQESQSRTMPGFERYMGKGVIGGNLKELDETDFEQMTVKGTSQTLEKHYLRLTAPPRAELVRPLEILRRHLENLKAERLRKTRRDYLWFCSQLKAVRQDCTVQRVQNAFAVDVYETHATIALEEGDLNEYNQCQTQLKDLYDLNRPDPAASKNRREFLAYRLLYTVFLTGNEKYDGGSSDLFKIMLSLTKEDRKDPAVRHALQVRSALADIDYHKFFCLRKECPNHGSYLMDRIVPSMRHKALLRICKGYRPAVETEFVLKELGFADDIEYGRKWLGSCGCLFSEDGQEIIAKDVVVRESDLEEKQSLI